MLWPCVIRAEVHTVALEVRKRVTGLSGEALPTTPFCEESEALSWEPHGVATGARMKMVTVRRVAPHSKLT